VLARTIEEAGIPTVTITMMPDLATKSRLSRIIGVEFPFSQAFGMIDDLAMQRKVAEAAVRLLEQAKEPETRQDLDIEWPVDTKTAYKAWQPPEISPIVAQNLEQIRKARREQES
jgi:D-proline reductase (dithiol) PrdB